MQSAPLIVLEGVDGAGKSTLQRGLASFLRGLGKEVVCSREPTQGPYGQALREAARTARLPPEEELRLLILDRKAHLQELIEPARSRGAAVILDRYYFSTLAYQGAAGVDTQEILRLHQAFAPEPDVLLVLDLPVEIALQRIHSRGAARDDFERSDTLQHVRTAMLQFGGLPFAAVLDAQMSEAELCGMACASLQKRLAALGFL